MILLGASELLGSSVVGCLFLTGSGLMKQMSVVVQDKHQVKYPVVVAVVVMLSPM